MLKDLRVGEAIIVEAIRGVNEPFCNGVKWGEKYIIAKISASVYQDFKIHKTRKEQLYEQRIGRITRRKYYKVKE